MTIMSSSRGAFRVIDLDASSGEGVQVTIANGGTLVGPNSLITSFSVPQAENFAVTQCLNGGMFVYTFGHDPNQSIFTIGIASFLNTCSGSSTAISDAVKTYQAGRVSVSKQLSSMSIGKSLFNGYLISQKIDLVNQDIGLVGTTYSFIPLNAHGDRS